MILTYKYRVKDGTKKDLLKSLAGHVNFVWNYTNDIIKRSWKESRKYTTKKDINPLIKGSSKLLNINSQTVQATAYECLLRTKKSKKHLRFRTGKKNLGWVPFNGQTVKFHGSYIDYNGFRFRLWEHRKLPKSAVLKTGSFSEDARGRWYVNLTFEAPDDTIQKSPQGTSVGIDPGVKTVLTTLDGEKFERESLTRKYEVKLAQAQRRGKKKQAKTVHAKIRNSRRDFNHKVSLDLAKRYQTIFFGDAGSKNLAKTRMAKSVADSSWYEIKTFLRYKTMRRGGRMLETSERNSTVTCSTCLEKTGPSGLSDLGVREWTCSKCQSKNDRDTNAARNILRLGHETLKALAC